MDWSFPTMQPLCVGTHFSFPSPQLEVDRKHVVVPCAMVHPQLVSAQVRDLALYRAYQAIIEQLQTAANAGRHRFRVHRYHPLRW